MRATNKVIVSLGTIILCGLGVVVASLWIHMDKGVAKMQAQREHETDVAIAATSNLVSASTETLRNQGALNFADLMAMATWQSNQTVVVADNLNNQCGLLYNIEMNTRRPIVVSANQEHTAKVIDMPRSLQGATIASTSGGVTIIAPRLAKSPISMYAPGWSKPYERSSIVLPNWQYPEGKDVRWYVGNSPSLVKAREGYLIWPYTNGLDRVNIVGGRDNYKFDYNPLDTSDPETGPDSGESRLLFSLKPENESPAMIYFMVVKKNDPRLQKWMGAKKLASN